MNKIRYIPTRLCFLTYLKKFLISYLYRNVYICEFSLKTYIDNYTI